MSVTCPELHLDAQIAELLPCHGSNNYTPDTTSRSVSTHPHIHTQPGCQLFTSSLISAVTGGAASPEVLPAAGRCAEPDPDPGASAGVWLSQTDGSHAQSNGRIQGQCAGAVDSLSKHYLASIMLHVSRNVMHRCMSALHAASLFKLLSLESYAKAYKCVGNRLDCKH